jgi:hypothetical protein
VVGGPGYGDSGLWLVVDGAGLQLYREGAVAGEQPVARLDLYTIQSWRGTPSQLHLQLTDGQVVSFDVQGGGYEIVRELEHVCQTLAAQQPVMATVVGTAPPAHVMTGAVTGAVDISAVQSGIAGCVTRLQEQMSLRWLAVSAEIARLRTAAEATAASVSMLDHLASTGAPEGSVCLDGRAGTDGAAEGGRGVCGACTFENETSAEQCTMCGCSLSPVGVSILGGTSPGSSAAAAELAGAAAVLGEAVEAEDVSWLVGALTSLQAEAGARGSSANVGAERLATVESLARWLEVAEERCLAWKCVGESLRAGEREELELWMEMLAEASATAHAENHAAGGATNSSIGEPVLRFASKRVSLAVLPRHYLHVRVSQA